MNIVFVLSVCAVYCAAFAIMRTARAAWAVAALVFFLAAAGLMIFTDIASPDNRDIILHGETVEDEPQSPSEA